MQTHILSLHSHSTVGWIITYLNSECDRVVYKIKGKEV